MPVAPAVLGRGAGRSSPVVGLARTQVHRTFLGPTPLAVACKASLAAVVHQASSSASDGKTVANLEHVFSIGVLIEKTGAPRLSRRVVRFWQGFLQFNP